MPPSRQYPFLQSVIHHLHQQDQHWTDNGPTIEKKKEKKQYITPNGQESVSLDLDLVV